CRGSPAAFFSPMVSACGFIPYSVSGGAFLNAPAAPPKPHIPDRSCGLKAWLSTLYFALASVRSLLFWQRGHWPQPSGAGTDSCPCGKARTEIVRIAIETPMKTICLRMSFVSTLNLILKQSLYIFFPVEIQKNRIDR